MVKFDYLPDSEAPRPEKPLAPNKRTEEMVEIITQMPAGQVARVVPEKDQSLRGMKVSYGRVASHRGIKVITWDDGQYLYVKKL